MSAATSSTHYIRTIHTSFTAAHAASGPWARTTTSTALPPLYHPQSTAQKYTTASPPPSAQGAPHQGRRRAYAFRVAPTPTAAPAPSLKFDPFADDPTPVPSLLPSSHSYQPQHVQQYQQPTTPRLAAAALPPSQHTAHLAAYRERSSTGAQGLWGTGFHQPLPVRRGFVPAQHYQQPQRRPQGQYHPQPRKSQVQLQQHGYIDSSSAQGDIWRTQQRTTTRVAPAAFEFEEYTDNTSYAAPSPRVQQQHQRQVPPAPVVRRAPAPAPALLSTPLAPYSGNTSSPTPSVQRSSAPAPRTPSPPAPAPISMGTPRPVDRDAKARLVAGIMLNRMCAGRRARRVPSPVGTKRAYVPSGLSKEVTMEA